MALMANAVTLHLKRKAVLTLIGNNPILMAIKTINDFMSGREKNYIKTKLKLI